MENAKKNIPSESVDAVLVFFGTKGDPEGLKRVRETYPRAQVAMFTPDSLGLAEFGTDPERLASLVEKKLQKLPLPVGSGK